MAVQRPKVMTVFGTRPEAIKIAPVIKKLDSDSRFELVIVSTGQHREMLEPVCRQFKVFPDYDLELMQRGQGLNALVARAIEGLDPIILKEEPDLLVVQGDTTTAMAAALAGFHRGVRIAHLEAGLRSGNLLSPFPEEANRKLISQLASLHLAPTQVAQQNLCKEGVERNRIVVTGNTVIDSLLEACNWNVDFDVPEIQRAVNESRKIVLVTTHRRENLDDMKEIGGAIRDLAEKYEELLFVLPLHLNPLVKGVLLPQLDGLENVVITAPMPYAQFTALLNVTHLVLTDSGGLQEEAPSLGVPVLLMRDNTERPEGVAAGAVKLTGTSRERIVQTTSTLIDDDGVYEKMSSAVNPYGDGHSAALVIRALERMYNLPLEDNETFRSSGSEEA